MDRYISIDSGKGWTKLAWTNGSFDRLQECVFATRMGQGDFEDDNIAPGTFIVQINSGEVLKIGKRAPKESSLETTKHLEIHRVCILLAHALLAEETGTKFHSVVGMPLSEYLNIAKRNDFIRFALPEGEIKVSYKTSKSEKVTKTFEIVSRMACPESLGGLYLDLVKNRNLAGIIDMGNLNAHFSYCTEREIDETRSKTSEHGAKILVSGLASALSGKFGRVDELVVTDILKRPARERMLTLESDDTALVERVKKESADIISNYVHDFVTDIKNECNALKWPIDYMPLTFIGGLALILEDDLRRVFGNRISIPKRPEFANVVGFLRCLVAKEAGKLLPVEVFEQDSNDVNPNKDKPAKKDMQPVSQVS